MTRLKFTSLTLAGVLFCSNGFADKSNPEKILFDFKGKNQIEKWSGTQGANISWMPAGSVNPGAMRLETPAYTGENNRWPGTITNDIPKDWSDYDELRLDVYPEAGICAEFPILVRSGKGNYFEKPSIDWQGHWGTVRYRINRAKLDTTDIKSLTIYQSHPGSAYAFRIDNIRLVNTVREKLTNLKKDYESIGDKASAGKVIRLLEDMTNKQISPAVARKQYLSMKLKARKASLVHLRKEFAKIHGKQNFTVVSADSSTRVLPQAKAVIARVPEKFSVSLARGEYEAIQPVIIAHPGKALELVSLKLSPLTLKSDSSKTFPAKYVSISPVGYVKTAKTSRITDYTGWYPDPILSFMKSVNIKAGETQPFWIRFFGGEDAVPGIYSGTVMITTKNADSIKIPVEVKVRNFAIPKRGHLKVATSVYTHKNLLKQNQLDKFYNFILDKYRISPFSIYSSSAYGEPELPEINEYLRMSSKGLNFIPLLYLKLPRQALHGHLSPSQSKAAWSAMSAQERKHYPEEWRKKFLKILEKRVPELKKAGLYDMSYCYGFDEANTSEWPACVELCRAIKAKFPDIKIISTAGDSSYGRKSILGSAIDGFIPLTSVYNYKEADDARKNGKEVWWYSTQMTVDSDSLTDIRNLLGKRSFDNNVDGFLVWTVSRWKNNNKPISSGPYTTWNPESYTGSNGGGSYFCAGPNGTFLPTLRSEAMRDGLEDYEYLYLLKKLASKSAPDSVLAKQAAFLLNKPASSDAADCGKYRNQVGDLIEKIIVETKK